MQHACMHCTVYLCSFLHGHWAPRQLVGLMLRRGLPSSTIFNASRSWNRKSTDFATVAGESRLRAPQQSALSSSTSTSHMDTMDISLADSYTGRSGNTWPPSPGCSLAHPPTVATTDALRYYILLLLCMYYYYVLLYTTMYERLCMARTTMYY